NNFYNSSPAISPNGQKMAFISDKGGTFRIFVRSIEKKDDIVELVGSLRAKDFEELNILTPGISWDPKGTKLAVSAKAGGEDAVYIVDAKSGNYEKLLFGLKSITSVNWSPDGKELVFVGIANEKSDLFLYDLSTKSLSKLTDDIFSDANPVWAPSSKKVYYVSDRADNLARNLNQNNYKIWDTKYNASDIYSIDIKTKDIKRITSDPEYQKTSIAVSPDESKLLYVSDKNGIGNIYEINLSTGKIRPKTNTLNAVTQLSLSPDGSKLLFTSQIHGGYDIFLIEYPFDKYLPSDTLPLTKFRDKMMQKNQLVANIKKSADSSASDSSNKKLTSYGDFDIEFSRQQVVKPNPDAERQYDTKDIVSGKMDNNDTTFIAHDYIIKFSPDLILTNYMYSTYWASQAMGQMMFSDVMGDHLIYIQANLWTDLKNSTFLVSYSYLPLIIDYTFTAFHSAGITYAIGSPGGIYGAYLYRFRKYGASLLASYPFDLFNRVEWGLSLINASKENLDLPQANDFISHNLLLPEGRYVHDNALWGLFGPMRGSRYMVEFKGTPKLSNSSVGFIDINADLRNYIPITSYMSFAVRFSAGKSFGPDPQFYYMGGEENWINARFKNGILPFSRPEDFVMMEMPMPLRGFAVSEVAGTQYFLTNAELRFPLFRALLAGPVPLLIQGIMGSFFFDMGGAWSGSLTSFKATIKDIAGNNIANDLLMSTGIGIRCYFLGLPLKIDVAWRNEYYAWSDPYWNFALGYDW
ncbi:MAG: BamA/TamA family outer membrane protein, partial [FCB group bacterium]